MLKNGLKAFSLDGSISEASTICLLLVGVQRTKDGSSLIIVRMSCCMALMGLNFIGAKGVGKKAQIMRSCSLVTKLFVANRAGVVGEVVCSVGLAWGVRRPRGPPWWKGVDRS